MSQIKADHISLTNAERHTDVAYHRLENAKLSLTQADIDALNSPTLLNYIIARCDKSTANGIEMALRHGTDHALMLAAYWLSNNQ